MFEYKVIRIPVSMWTGKPNEDYVSVIQEYAAEGWRFVQVFNPFQGNATKKYFEIIFEKPILQE